MTFTVAGYDFDADDWAAWPLHGEWPPDATVPAPGGRWAHEFVEAPLPVDVRVDYRCRRCVLAVEANGANGGTIGDHLDPYGEEVPEAVTIEAAHAYAAEHGWMA